MALPFFLDVGDRIGRHEQKHKFKKTGFHINNAVRFVVRWTAFDTDRF